MEADKRMLLCGEDTPIARFLVIPLADKVEPRDAGFMNCRHRTLAPAASAGAYPMQSI
jgi:hypothetical protein